MTEKKIKNFILFVLFSVSVCIAIYPLIKISKTTFAQDIFKNVQEKETEDSRENEQNEDDDLLNENSNLQLNVTVINLNRLNQKSSAFRYRMSFINDIVPPPPKNKI